MARKKIHDSIDNYDVTYKLIPGYDFEYFVTTDGRVWTTSRKNGIERWMKQTAHKDGYLHVGLWKDRVEHIKRVHRLVAEAFIPNPENKPYVNHIDGNRQNNHVENLEWCTQRENVLHAIHVLKRWSSWTDNAREKARLQGFANRKLTLEDAKKIREEYASGTTSCIKLSRKYSLNKKSILDIIHNKSYKE